MPADLERPILVVGRGLIGGSVKARLHRTDASVITVARGGITASDHRTIELAEARGRAQLRADLDELAPRCVVVCHGPSDVTWIERDEAGAAATHCGVAEVIADSGIRAVFVSTDNVFSGEHGHRGPEHVAGPQNAYGRIKLRSERLLLDGGSALIVRVSLVYGWAGPAHRETYGERCLEGAIGGRLMLAPTDQAFTPIHVDDVAAVISAVTSASGVPTGVRHLAGPVELSRYDFAVQAYRVAGADTTLVRPCLRRDTEWASRPRYSSLAGSDFGDFGELAGWRPLSPVAGLSALLAERTPPPVAEAR